MDPVSSSADYAGPCRPVQVRRGRGASGARLASFMLRWDEVDYNLDHGGDVFSAITPRVTSRRTSTRQMVQYWRRLGGRGVTTPSLYASVRRSMPGAIRGAWHFSRIRNCESWPRGGESIRMSRSSAALSREIRRTRSAQRLPIPLLSSRCLLHPRIRGIAGASGSTISSFHHFRNTSSSARLRPVSNVTVACQAAAGNTLR